MSPIQRYCAARIQHSYLRSLPNTKRFGKSSFDLNSLFLFVAENASTCFLELRFRQQKNITVEDIDSREVQAPVVSEIEGRIAKLYQAVALDFGIAGPVDEVIVSI